MHYQFFNYIFSYFSSNEDEFIISFEKLSFSLISLISHFFEFFSKNYFFKIKKKINNE